MLSGLDTPPAMRARVDRQDVAIAEQVDANSGMIRNQLRTLSKTATVAGTAIDLVGHTSAMKGKERIGVARAVGSAGFGGGSFMPGEIRRLPSLIAARGLLVRNHGADTRDAAHTPLERMQASPALPRFAAMSDYALRPVPARRWIAMMALPSSTRRRR